MKPIYAFNRWWDDLERTDPVARTLYFFAVTISVLFFPLAVQLIFGPQEVWVHIAPVMLMCVIGMFRAHWLLWGHRTYKRDSDK